MATYTSHYNLTKPEGTERVNIGIINQNMDSIDAQMYKNAQSIIANHGGMAIPSNNNTHAAVSSGQYVYVYNHSSLAEGLYIAKSAISTNGALSLSNLTAVSNGGLNHVYSTLNSKMTLETVAIINGACYLYVIGNICILNIAGPISQAPTGSQTIIATLDTNYRPIRTACGVIGIEGGSANKYSLITINAQGEITIYNYSGGTAHYLYGSIVFVRDV